MKRINQFFFMRPWAIEYDVLNVMVEVIERRTEGIKLSQEEISARIPGDKKIKPSYEIMGTMAVIPVYGIIAKRMNMVNDISQPDGTSVEEILNNLNLALQDNQVEMILFDVDSPGGSADGVAELSDFIYTARDMKPIFAFTDGTMASAAYWIGSSAEKIFATKGSLVGSIGVYSVVRDFSVFEHNKGVKTSIIKAGKYKAAGHPSAPMTEEEKSTIQEIVDSVYENFVDAVARNRGMSVEDTKTIATGQTFSSRKALARRLIDEVDSKESIFAKLSTMKNPKKKKPATYTLQPTNDIKADIADMDMEGTVSDQSNQDMKTEGETMEPKILTVEQLKADHKALADSLIEEGKALGVEEGKRQAAKEAIEKEQQRVASILSSMPPNMEKVALQAIKSGLDANQAKDEYLKAMQNAAPKTPGPDANIHAEVAPKVMTPDEHLKAARVYHDVHGGSLTDALKATAPARTKQSR